MNYKKNDLGLYVPLQKQDTYAVYTAEQMQLVEARYVITVESIINFSFNWIIQEKSRLQLDLEHNLFKMGMIVTG